MSIQPDQTADFCQVPGCKGMVTLFYMGFGVCDECQEKHWRAFDGKRRVWNDFRFIFKIPGFKLVVTKLPEISEGESNGEII